MRELMARCLQSTGILHGHKNIRNAWRELKESSLSLSCSWYTLATLSCLRSMTPYIALLLCSCYIRGRSKVRADCHSLLIIFRAHCVLLLLLLTLHKTRVTSDSLECTHITFTCVLWGEFSLSTLAVWQSVKRELGKFAGGLGDDKSSSKSICYAIFEWPTSDYTTKPEIL